MTFQQTKPIALEFLRKMRPRLGYLLTEFNMTGIYFPYIPLYCTPDIVLVEEQRRRMAAQNWNETPPSEIVNQ
jgi:hypothetical protein